MVDWLKMICRDWHIIQKFIASELVDFKKKVNVSTGEIDDDYLEGEKSGFKFKIKSQKYMEVSGSIHKYHEGGVNDTDFTISMLCKAVQKFECDFELPASSLKIVNIEFGVNILTIVSPQTIMDDLICYKNYLPSKDERKSNNGRLIVYTMTDYEVKLYDKGSQYFLSKNLLRIEFKVKKSRMIAALGIETLDDLLSESSLIQLKDLFMYLYQGFAFDDYTINTDDLSLTDSKVYEKLSNPKEWSKVKGEKKNTHRAREKRFRGIVNKYGQQRHFDTISELVENKFGKLLGNKTLAVFTP